jgi:hypothetical protein
VIKSKGVRWVGHVAHMGEMRNIYKILVGKLEGTIPLEKYRHKYQYNIRLDLKQVEKSWTVFVWLRLGTSGGLF